MKTFKNVEMVAKNAPSGSYAAGCPQHTAGQGEYNYGPGNPRSGCRYCECTK